MPVLKTFLILMLLLFGGNAAYAGSGEAIALGQILEDQPGHEYAWDSGELLWATPAATPAVPELENFPVAQLGYQHQSARCSLRTSRYVRLSRFIVPGLDLYKLIFPFHFFF